MVNTRSGRKAQKPSKRGAKASKTESVRRPRKKRVKAERPARAASRARSELLALFPELASRNKLFGLGIHVAVAQRQGTQGEIQHLRLAAFHTKPGQRPRSTVYNRGASPEDLARLLTGFAHADRIRLAQAIEAGANTHRALSKATGLKTGPLYHHLRELERAGLLTTLARNAYALSELGRVVLLVCSALDSKGRGGRSGWHAKRLKCRA
jgi:hypothetical protein